MDYRKIKYSAFDFFYEDRNKLQAFMIQMDIYEEFSRTRISNLKSSIHRILSQRLGYRLFLSIYPRLIGQDRSGQKAKNQRIIQQLYEIQEQIKEKLRKN